MRRIISLNIATFLTFIALSVGAYYFLTSDRFLPTSISSIIYHSHDLAITKHLIVLGLLPFYIAGVIFGAAILSLYLGAMIQRCFKKFAKCYKSRETKNSSLRDLPSSL